MQSVLGAVLLAVALAPLLRKWLWAERIIWRHNHPRPQPKPRREPYS